LASPEFIGLFSSTLILTLASEGLEEAEKVEIAVEDLNSTIQNVQRNLAFSVDKDLEQIVVNITDKNTDEVIRQIPSEEFLELARNLQDMVKEKSSTDISNSEGILFNAEA